MLVARLNLEKQGWLRDWNRGHKADAQGVLKYCMHDWTRRNKATYKIELVETRLMLKESSYKIVNAGLWDWNRGQKADAQGMSFNKNVIADYKTELVKTILMFK